MKNLYLSLLWLSTITLTGTTLTVTLVSANKNTVVLKSKEEITNYLLDNVHPLYGTYTQEHMASFLNDNLNLQNILNGLLFSIENFNLGKQINISKQKNSFKIFLNIDVNDEQKTSTTKVTYKNSKITSKANLPAYGFDSNVNNAELELVLEPESSDNIFILYYSDPVKNWDFAFILSPYDTKGLDLIDQ